MGILPDVVAILRTLPLSAGFSVCELGDQYLSGGKRPVLASEFYRSLGCGRYVSIDGNGRGTVTADLNLSITALNLGTFDLVTDFGTGEHIFDQAQVWRTLHQLTAPGGYLAIDRPLAGYGEHCFYLVTEGLVRDVAAANDYQILRVERRETPRGVLIRAVFRRPAIAATFRVPQQQRYQASLQVPGAR